MFDKRYSLIFLLAVFAGCGSVRNMSVPTLGLTAHRIDIQQGNVITQDMLDKLKPGMTRSQVRFVLGTPLLIDPFRNDRWDYVYLLEKRGDLVEKRQLRVFFKDDKMVRYEGDVVADKPAPDATAAVKPTAKPEVKPDAKPPEVKPVAKPAVEPPLGAASAPKAELAKPVGTAPEKPAVAPAPETPAAAQVRPQLRLAPDVGEPAKTEAPANAAPASDVPAAETLPLRVEPAAPVEAPKP